MVISPPQVLNTFQETTGSGGHPESESESRSVVSDSFRPHGLYSPWNSPGQNTGVGSLLPLQGIFPTQGLNPGLPHCRWILYHLSHQGSLYSCTKVRNDCQTFFCLGLKAYTFGFVSWLVFSLTVSYLSQPLNPATVIPKQP